MFAFSGRGGERRPAPTRPHAHSPHAHNNNNRHKATLNSGVNPRARDAHLLHLPRLLRHATADDDEGVGEGEIVDGALIVQQGLALGGALAERLGLRVKPERER